MQIDSEICRTAVLALALWCASPGVDATTYACWGDTDALKLRHEITVPAGTREAFILYLKEQVAIDQLSLSTVRADDDISLIFQNVDDGILAITIRNRAPSRRFDIMVMSCDFKPNWTPYWRYIQASIDRFMKNPERATPPAWPPNKPLERSRER